MKHAPQHFDHSMPTGSHGNASHDSRTPNTEPHGSGSQHPERDLPKIAIRLSLGASFLMLAGKWTAYVLSGSDAILSDAAESVVHLAATGIAAFSLWYSRRPADPSHPYGHGKIAYFSAGFEGAFIMIAALTIVGAGITSLIRGVELRQLGIGIVITFALGLFNLGLGAFLIRVGRRHNTFTLVANGHHVLTDTWTSLGVVAGVTLVWLTGIEWIDPCIAIAVGLWIGKTAFELLHTAFDGLMERVDASVAQTIVKELEGAVRDGKVVDFHQLRYREIDGELWVDFHVLVPAHLQVDAAHQRVTELERAIERALPNAKVRISSHVEPAELHRSHHPTGHEGTDPFDTN